MSDSIITGAAVRDIARVLLPGDEMRALDEIGETRYHLPHRSVMGCDDFIVDVTDAGEEICVDIEHHRIAAPDDVPEELFEPAHP